MAIQLQIKRGLKKDLPALAAGEFGLCEDTGELFVGSAGGNLPVRLPEGAGDMLQKVYDTNADGTVDRADEAARLAANGCPLTPYVDKANQYAYFGYQDPAYNGGKLSSMEYWRAKTAGDADTVDGKHASEFATSAQGQKADIAVTKHGGLESLMTGGIPFATTSGWKIWLLPDSGGTNGGFSFACQDKNGNWGNTALIFDGATGAWRFRGGDADGYFRFGTSNTGLEWYTASGTRYRLRPWSPSNVFQITRTTSGGAEQGILNIYEASAEFIGNADTATVASKLRISGADASVFYNADSDWVYFSRDGKIVNYHQAKRAVADESNNNIKSTYLASIDTSGNTIRAKNKNGSVLYTVTPPYAAKAANAANATFPISYGKIVSRGDQKLALYASGETDRALFFGVTSVAKLWTLAPDYDYQLCLGDPNYRWAQIYSNQPTINTSDRDQKTEIRALEPDTALAFLAALEPVSYKMRDGTSGRTHWGLIAQDVWNAMQQAGLSDMDFAGYCRDVAAERVQIVRQVPVTDPDDGDILGVEDTLEEEDIPAETEEGSPRYIYGLRYEEFISLALFGAQEALRRAESLETECQALHEENKTLQDALAALTAQQAEMEKRLAALETI